MVPHKPELKDYESMTVEQLYDSYSIISNIRDPAPWQVQNRQMISEALFSKPFKERYDFYRKLRSDMLLHGRMGNLKLASVFKEHIDRYYYEFM